MEYDARKGKLARQHLRGQSVAFAIKAGLHPFTITISDREIVRQADRARLRRSEFHWRLGQLHSEGARLKSSQARHQLSVHDRSLSKRQLLSIYFTRCNHRRRKSEPHVRYTMPIQLDDAHDHFIAIFGLLERQHTHTTVIDVQDRKHLSQSPRMLCAVKCDQRLVETLRVPVSLRTAPITAM